MKKSIFQQISLIHDIFQKNAHRHLRFCKLIDTTHMEGTLSQIIFIYGLVFVLFNLEK